MTRLGREFLSASVPARKTLFRQQILNLRLFQILTSRLRETPDGWISTDEVLRELATLLPYDQPEKLLEALIAWGRYAEIIDYDQNTRTVFLQTEESDATDVAPPPSRN